MKFQRPKGTEDLYNEKIILFNNIINSLTKVAKSYNFKEIMTPIFESTQLFLRAIGQETDIVEKEIYQFFDKSQRDMALRPEGTAGVIRAVIENKLYTNNQRQALKYYYQGPMYRYEQPQKGRKREFHQFGIEVLGTKNPWTDVEIILLALDMIKSLEIKNYRLNLNFFGSEATKQAFQKVVLQALKNKIHLLCDDCKNRINNNPLRVLDCKKCRNIDLHLPKLAEVYSSEEKEYFNEVIKILDKHQINFTIEENLVRGLDYYNGIIFEVTTDDASLGQSQNTIVGGGRYDNLCQQLGTPTSYPAIGFAFGIERLMLLLENNLNFNRQEKLKLYIVSLYESGLMEVLNILKELRNKNYFVDGNFSVYNDKQKSSLLKTSEKNIDNILILVNEHKAFFHNLSLLERRRTEIEFLNSEELLQKTIKLLEYFKE